ncbi:MAG: DUF6465 family protein [Lachnospiraceae bacterium]|nr:DUF6465 family protein [Lachnospiraceae bacterium]
MARRKARAAVEAAKNVAAKKAEEVKEVVETVAEAVEEKVEEVKEEVAPAVEEVKEEAAAVVEEVEEVEEEAADSVAEEKKRPGRKPGSKNKTTVKEVKKEEPVTEVYLQFGPGESSLQTVVDRIKAEYVEQNHRVSSIKSLKVYLKPEDRSAYYVINDKVAGRVDLF